MDVLNQIIDKLSKEEIRNFKLFYNAAENAERKDLQLFNYIRNSGHKFDEEKAIRKLHYDTDNKNNYYRLKNRLIEDIGDSLTLLHTHKNELYELLQFITLFHIYHARNLFKTCLFYLRKAERLANVVENYELLDIVYSSFIRLSANLIEIEPEVYIEKREKNAVVVSSLRELDDILATLSYRLKISQNFGSVDKDLLKKLQAKIKAVNKITTAGFGRNLEARVYNALSQVFLQQHNYVALEKLVNDTYTKFEEEKWFDKSNHDLKLQMLIYYVNSLYKNNKFKESLEYAEVLGEAINAFNKLHYEKYLFFYTNAKVLNYAVLNPQRGLKVLDDFETEMRKKENTYYDFFIYLNRAALLYDTGKFKDALKNLVRLYVSDGYTKADKAFKLRVEVSELIMTFESGERETLGYRIDQVRKSFASLQKQTAFKRDFEIIQLIADMNLSTDYKRDENIQKRIRSLLKGSFETADHDNQIIRYRDWLQLKLKS